MSNLDIQFGSGQGNMDDFMNSGEPEDAGTIHGIEPKRRVQDELVRAPEETSDATFDDDKES